MKTIKTTMGAAMMALSICMVSCSGGHKDAKDQAEDVNQQNLSKDAEKESQRLVDAYSSNLCEIRNGENALTKAVTADVKELATMLVSAHSKMNEEVKRLADSRNVTLPSSVSDDDQKKIEKMNEKSGLDFDKEFTKEMKDKHEHAVKKYEKDAESSDDTAIKQWASNSLTEVKSHLDMVNSTWEKIKDMKEEARGKGGAAH
jgi:putative membrane protein